jgi:hypothetical protein
MRRLAVTLVLLISAQFIPAALAAKPKCTNQQLVSLNKQAIEYNDNRTYFLKYIVYATEANDGLLRSRRANDAGNEASFRESFSIATVNAKKTADSAKRIEKQIRTAFAKCESGYGISYTSDYGFLQMKKSIKGVKFPTFFIRSVAVQPRVSPTSSGSSAKPSPSPSTLTLISGVNDKEFFEAQGNRLLNLNAIASQKYKCDSTTSCKIGRIGPGGGIVFYDAGERKSWGRYLEVAPFWWDRNVVPLGRGYDPIYNWCVPKSESIKQDAENIFSATDGSIGSGPSNTQLLVDNCLSGAGHAVKSYKGGGFDDWYLPTSQELYLIGEYTKESSYSWWDALKIYIDSEDYWSSHCASFGYGCGYINSPSFGPYESRLKEPLRKWEKESSRVRPVRAF